jgi:autoinducer 2 (AI-2) kinase
MSASRWLMGLDLGGGGVRCLLLDVDRGESRVVLHPWREFGGAGVDLDLDALFGQLGACIREAWGGAPSGAEVIGIAVSAVRFGTVVLGGDDRPLLAATNRDSRAAQEAIALAQEAGPLLQARTGHWPMAIGSLGRLALLAKQGTLASARAVLALNDWVAWRLTGELATDLSQAGASGVWDLAAGVWAEDVLARVGADPASFPRVLASGTKLGALRAEPAEALGLSPGIPVAVGGGDTQCALFGMAALGTGSVGAVCGTTMPIQAVAFALPQDPSGALWQEPHLAPGAFVVESNAGPAGEAADWLGRLLHPGERSGAARLLAEADASEPGAGGLFSSFGVQLHDARAMVFPVGDLALSHLVGEPESGRRQLMRAVVEGLGFGLRQNLEQIRGAVAADLPLRLGGGMSRSRSFAKLVASILGEPVERVGWLESTAVGAALCAGIGAGVFDDLADACRALPEPERLEPDAEAAPVYAETYPAWLEWRESRGPGDAIVQGQALRRLAASHAARGPAGVAVRPRILVSADLDDEALGSLRALGEVTDASYRKVGRLLQGESLVEALAGYQVLVTEIDLVDAGSMLALPELRVVAACRGDAVNVDAEAAARLGIPVLHAPGRNADAVADLTVAFLLALARKLPEAITLLRDPSAVAGDLATMGRAYATLRGRELWRKTVGLVGLGAVGRKVAERLLPFGAEILVYDPWLPEEQVHCVGARSVSLDTLLAGSDFVSLHAAVTDESRGLLGADAIARMKPDACVVNTARAALLDEDALAAALEEGRLAGAALDVFSEEPPGPEHPLLQAPGVIATPHVGGNTSDVGAHQGRIVGDDLARLVRGETPRHLVRRDAFEGFRWDAPRADVDAATREWLLARPAPSLTDLQRDKGKRGKGDEGKPEPKK